MTDEELIARMDHWVEQEVFGLTASDILPIRDRIEALVKERDEAINQLDSARHSVDVLEKRVAHFMSRAERLEEAADYILDGMGIDAPDYEIDPDDDFLDAANSEWARDVLTRLAAALRGLEERG